MYRMPNTRAAKALSIFALIASGISQPAVAQTGSDDELVGDEIVTTGRQIRAVEDVPQAVLIVEEEEIRRQLEASTSVAEALGRLIPGFSAPRATGGGAGISLRGRRPLFLIDGVRVRFNQTFEQYLNSFDAGFIERIEVIYGPSAAYGQGAAGGVIQLFSKSPSDKTLEGRVSTSLKAFAADDNLFDQDGITSKTALTLSGSLEDLGYVFHGSFERQGADYRADGDQNFPERIQLGHEFQLFGKLVYDFDADQSLTVSAQYFRQRQQQGAFDLIAVTDPQGFQISAPAPLPQSYANVPGNESLFANVIYTNDDLFGGFLKLQGYYRENEFINPGSDIRAAPLPPWFPGLWQTGQDANEIGVRAEYTRDFFDMVEITVGGDYTREDYFNTLLITDPTNFNTTGFFDGSTETFQSPPNVLTSYGAFLQAQVEVTDEMSVSGGVRYDTFSFSLDPYDVVFDFPIQAGVRQGGDGGADGFTFNFGGTYAVTDDVTVFANFGQGFLIPAVGFAANQVQPGVPLGLADALEPIKTTSYDIGVRGTEGPVDFALAGFFSSSELGDNLTLGQAGIGQRVRSPQRNYGFEVALNWRATEDLTLGTTITWNDGEFDANDTGNFTAINSLFVDPIKITANADYQVTENLNLFASLFHVGNRTRAFEQGTDRNPPDSYTLVDVGAGYVLGDFDLGLQVTNLFNEDYASVFQSTFIPGRRRSGPGRAVWLSAAYNFEH